VLGPEKYGVYRFIISFLFWIEFIIISGIPVGINKFTASNKTESLIILRAGNKITAFMSIFLFCLIVLISTNLSKIFNLGHYKYIFTLSFINILFFGFYYNYHGFQTGLFNYNKVFLIRISYALSRLLFILLLLYLIRSVLAGILGNILASVSGLLVGIFFYLKDKNRYEIKDRNEINKKIKIYIKKIVIFAIPITGYVLFFRLIKNIDLWIVKYYFRNEIVGFYGCAQTLSNAFFLISLGFCTAMFPRFVKNITNNNIKLVNHHIRQTLRVYIILFIPLIIFLNFYSRYIIEIFFGREYLASSGLFEILLVAYWFLSIYFFFSYLFFSTKKDYYIPIVVSFILVVFQIFLSKALLNIYAEKGVALAVLLVGIIGIMIYLVSISKKFKNLKQIFQKEMFISIIMSTILVFILKIIWTEKLFTNLISTIFLSFLYIFICLRFKMITKEDINKIKEIFIKNKSVVRYV